MNKIVWFKTGAGEEEVALIKEAIVNERVSMGPITQELENRISQALAVPYCVITPSGSVAIFIALKALGIGPGDEVIVPNRGWVAAAHAVILGGAKVVLADVQRDIPNIAAEDVQKKITAKTRAIIPLHLNGRSADMRGLFKLAKDKGIAIIEDACQSFLSKNEDGFIGTQGEMGCFSLGMTKLVATGQGGFVVTHKKGLFQQLRLIRNHGVKDNFTDAWYQWGFNFKFTDIQAAMGIAQLAKAPGRIQHLKDIYAAYDRGIAGLKGVRLIPVHVVGGEIPLYIEVLVERRDELIPYLNDRGIQARPATPDLDLTPYFENSGTFENSRIFSSKGMYLPGGPEQPMENVERVIEILREFEAHV